MSDLPQFAILGAQTRRPREAPVRPLMEAQADELCRRYRELTTPSDLQPGDLCVEKDGLGFMVADLRPTHLFIVVCHIDPDSFVHRAIVEEFIERGRAIPQPDCFVAMLHDTGTVLEIQPHQLSQLRPWDGGAEAAAMAQLPAA